jgi:hypothetical protein
MKKYVALAAILAITACDRQQAGSTTADSVGAGAAFPSDTMTTTPDTTTGTTGTDTSMVRDSASQ